MTTPAERSRSIRAARNFLRSLLDPKQTPRIPKAIREEAYWRLRHFPADLDIRDAAQKAPEIFAEIKPETPHVDT
jgi:hypothetical protein